MLNVHNYQLIRLDRQQRNSLGHTKAGGGICLFIKNNIIYDDDMFKHLNTSEKNVEAQFVLIAGKDARKIIIANCYRPPNGNIDLGMNVLKTQLGSIRNIDKYELVIMGDLNLDCRVGSFFRGAVYSRFLPWFLPSGRNYFFQFLLEESGRNQHFLEILYYYFF